MIEYIIFKLINKPMDLSKKTKGELIAMVGDLQLETISLRAENTILREQAIKKAPSK